MVALYRVRPDACKPRPQNKQPRSKSVMRRDFLLRQMAKKAGVDPESYLRSVLETTSSFPEAAEFLGITRKTLWRWRREMGIEVAR